MPLTTRVLAALCALSTPLLAQEELYSVSATELLHPEVLATLADVDGDGASELAIGRRTISGLARVQVHSGGSGELLYIVGAPNGPLFYGHMICPLDDLSGDGIPDFAVVGSQSGDSHSPPGVLDVLSGADGTVFSRFDPPAGTSFSETPPAIALDDVDGDGHPDVLVRIFGPTGDEPDLQAFSTATGQPLYVAPNDPDVNPGSGMTLVDDLDGDGVTDFAAGVIDFTAFATALELRSGRTGDLLFTHLGAVGFDGDSLVSVPDLDGDGLRDVASTNHFEDQVNVFGSVSGALLRTFQGAGSDVNFGGRILDVGDLDLDGAPEILITRLGSSGSGTVGAYSLASGLLLFEVSSPNGGCCFGFALANLPGADPEGFAAFALLDLVNEVADPTYVLRYAPRVGESYCTPTQNSTGFPALIEALGTTSLALDHLLLAADSLPALQFGIFFYGSARQEVPFGNGLLCVAPGTTGLGRLAVQRADTAGRITHRLDYDHPPSDSTRILAGSTWHFQTWFRDPMGGGAAFDTSDGRTLVFLP